MSYRWKRKESVRKAVRRLGSERMDHALACVEQQSRTDASHGARKDIKKARAVLRLVQDGVRRKERRRTRSALRDAAATLSGVRDTLVKAESLHDLMDRYKRQIARGALRQLRIDLHATVAAELKRFNQRKARQRVGRALRRARRAFQQLTRCGRGWNALRRGVQATYRAGRRACATALDDPSSDNLHTWRKRVKDLWYQMRLLRRMWPEQMKAIATELEQLATALGDDHDLVMLQQDVGARISCDERELLNGLVEQRRHELHAEAFALGTRLYAEKPAAFCARLGVYWRIWRRGRVKDVGG